MCDAGVGRVSRSRSSGNCRCLCEAQSQVHFVCLFAETKPKMAWSGATLRPPQGRLCFEKLQEHGPPRGCFLEPDKSILGVMEPDKVRAKAAFPDLDFKVITRSRHLGSFIGEKVDQKTWVEAQAAKWASAVGEMANAWQPSDIRRQRALDSGQEALIASWMCASLTLMSNPTACGILPSARVAREGEETKALVFTSPLLSVPWMVCLEERPKPLPNV